MAPNGGRLAEQLGPGTLVNRIYRIVRLLGVGGMGEVWEARHERTKGRVAIKLLLPEMGRNREVLRRFQREVEITSGLNHPNIVRVSDADNLPDGRPFLVMEFLEGQDLANYAAGQRLGLSRVIDIIEQAAMGLHAAHSRSVIHRDLKPANLFIVPLPGSERPLVKVLDFGISKALDGLSKLTHTRNLMGTPNYMAPEQATGGASSMDARADQFSLAAIAYELLAGRRAFEGDGMVNVLYKVLNEQPPSLASVGATVPRAVEDAMMKALSKSAEGRFGTVLEFSQAVKRAAETGLPGVIAERSRFELPTPVVQATPSTPVVTTLGATTGQIEAVRDSPELAASVNGLLPRRPRKSTLAFMAGGATLAFVVIFLSVAVLRDSQRGSRSTRIEAIGPTSGLTATIAIPVPSVRPKEVPAPVPSASAVVPAAKSRVSSVSAPVPALAVLPLSTAAQAAPKSAVAKMSFATRPIKPPKPAPRAKKIPETRSAERDRSAAQGAQASKMPIAKPIPRPGPLNDDL